MSDAPLGSNLQDLVSKQQQLVIYAGQLVQAFKNTFLQFGGTTTSATGGSATLPSNPVGFVSATLPNGTQVKIPYYGS